MRPAAEANDGAIGRANLGVDQTFISGMTLVQLGFAFVDPSARTGVSLKDRQCPDRPWRSARHRLCASRVR